VEAVEDINSARIGSVIGNTDSSQRQWQGSLEDIERGGEPEEGWVQVESLAFRDPTSATAGVASAGQKREAQKRSVGPKDEGRCEKGRPQHQCQTWHGNTESRARTGGLQSVTTRTGR